MNLENVQYFKYMKLYQPKIFELVERVIRLSMQDSGNKEEFERRQYLLGRVPDSNGEQRRKACDFLCEMISFDIISQQGREPRWVPEANYPTPDIEFQTESGPVAVEVKHLDSPRDEDEALSSGRSYGGSVNKSYELGLQKKVCDFLDSANSKFSTYSRLNGERSPKDDTLFLYFSRSMEAIILDGIEWELNMKDRIQRIVAENMETRTFRVDLSELDEHFRQ